MFDHLEGSGITGFSGGMQGGGGHPLMNPLMAAMGSMGGDPVSGALKKAMGVEKEYLDPFIDRGSRAGGLIEDEFGRMMKDPASMLEGFMDDYTPSKFHDMMQERLGQAASNTAAAGGMRGSPLEQTQQQELTQSLLSKDMQQYLQNIMGLHTQGLAGEQGLYGTGFQAARGLTSDLSNLYGSEAQLAFQRQQASEQRRLDEQSKSGGFFDDLLGLAGTVAGSFFGPAGAAAGGAAGHAVGNAF